MKILVVLLALLIPGGAVAADNAAASKWVAAIVSNRVVKTWTPALYAAPKTAAELGVVAGLRVQSDPAMKERLLEIRNVEPIEENGRSIVPAGTAVAALAW